MANHKPLWTLERVAELRAAALAGKTVPEVAAELHLTVRQVRDGAAYYDIRLRPCRGDKNARLRERWAAIIPELKAKLVRELRRAG